jgi:hypothetical protein
MANPHPDLYIVRVGAKPIVAPASGRAVCGALTFEVERRPGKGSPEALRSKLDPHTLVVRPGDSVRFEIGTVELPSKAPELRLEWRSPTGKAWKGAPAGPGVDAKIPAKEGYAGQIFCYRAEIDLGEDIHLPAQQTSERGTTVVAVDPDIIVDEC